ncbi:UNVERIFIED_CONTAM: hypothetical protein FKN15_056110 [Acipenser sinensis]
MAARRGGAPAAFAARRGGAPAAFAARRGGSPAAFAARRGGSPAAFAARRGGSPAAFITFTPITATTITPSTRRGAGAASASTFASRGRMPAGFTPTSKERESLLVPPPPAEGRDLLATPPLPSLPPQSRGEEQELPLPPAPPTEGGGLLASPPPLPSPPSPPPKDACLALPKDASLAPPKDASLAPPKDASLAPPRDAMPFHSGMPRLDRLGLPVAPHRLGLPFAPYRGPLPLPSPPEGPLPSSPPEGPQRPCLAPPKDASLAPPKDASLAPPRDASLAPPRDASSASPGTVFCSPQDTGDKGEVELPLPPLWPGAPLPSSPPEGPLLLPSPPEGPLLLPSPPEGPLLLPSPPEGPLLLPSPPEGPLLLPGCTVVGAPKRGAAGQEEGGEVRRPDPPAALSRQEEQWLKPRKRELPARKTWGEEDLPPWPPPWITPDPSSRTLRLRGEVAVGAMCASLKKRDM